MTVLSLFALSLLAQAAPPGSDKPPVDALRGDGKAATAAQPKPQAAPDLPDGSELKPRKRPEAFASTDKYLAPDASTVDANDVLDEMLDQLAADVAKLQPSRIGPILIERIRLSDNLNPDFAPVLEARLAASVARAADVALVRCAECWATRGRLEDGAWVVSRGVNRKEELEEVARKYSARTVLTVALTLVDNPSTLAMDVELVRADDSSIAFAEQYRMNPDTALLYRGVDRTQSRLSRLKELQDRIDQRPRFSQEAGFGVMFLSNFGNLSWGALARYALTEQFGENGVGEVGIEGGGYISTTTFSAGLVGGVLRLRPTDAQILAQDFRFVMHAGALITAGATSFYGGGGFRWKPAVRVTVFFLFDYVAPFQPRANGPRFGEFAPQLGAGFTWQ
jgi:hypothetical protein